MAPWGLCLHKGFLCLSLPKYLHASLVSVWWPHDAVTRWGRCAHNYSSHIWCPLGSGPPGTPQHTAHRNAVSLCKEKINFAGIQEAAIPYHAIPSQLLCSPQVWVCSPKGRDVCVICAGAGFGSSHWFFCVAGETSQLALIWDLRPEKSPFSLGSTSALLSFLKALLRLWSLFWPSEDRWIPLRVPHVALYHIKLPLWKNADWEKDLGFTSPQFILF